MMSPARLEEVFCEYMNNLDGYAPDGVMEVDLPLLHSLDLLRDWDEPSETEMLTHYFHVIETQEKLTLFNEQFAAWIVPYAMESEPVTLTLVAAVDEEAPHLELAFMTTGVYNTSRTVLKVLERTIQDIRETESVLARLSQTG
jgi:hypothetical protein